MSVLLHKQNHKTLKTDKKKDVTDIDEGTFTHKTEEDVYLGGIPVFDEPRYYLMRWNPAISSFKEEDYEKCVANMTYGMFCMNWSIYEWEEARRGDYFYMMRTGDDKAGIVFRGLTFTVSCKL